MLAVMNPAILLFSALPDGADVPEWLHLVPAGTFSGVDGRGPFTLGDHAEFIKASLQHANGRLPIDENHAIDLAAPKGGPSPSRGWIVELESRTDGIWGRVEWTAEGRALVASRAYRGISPALMRKKSGSDIVAVVRASLVNEPNLSQLTTLHSRSTSMEFMAQLRQALGLGADAAEDVILGAVTTNKTAIDTHAASLVTIAKAIGLAETADAGAVVVELQARAAAGGDVAKLTKTVIELQTQLSTTLLDTAKKEATRFIDAAIEAGKVGVKPLRDHYIERHMKDPAGVAKEIDAMVSIHGGGFKQPRGEQPAGAEGLTAEEVEVAELMGVDAKAYAASRKQLGMENL